MPERPRRLRRAGRQRIRQGLLSLQATQELAACSLSRLLLHAWLNPWGSSAPHGSQGQYGIG